MATRCARTPGLEHAGPVSERLLPEGGDKAREIVLFVTAPDVVDQNVEAALLLRDAGEQGFDLGVRGVVAADADPVPAPLRDRIRGFPNRAGKPFGGAARVTAACEVDGRARFPESQSDALADAATGPGDYRHPSAQR